MALFDLACFRVGLGRIKVGLGLLAWLLACLVACLPGLGLVQGGFRVGLKGGSHSGLLACSLTCSPACRNAMEQKSPLGRKTIPRSLHSLFPCARVTSLIGGRIRSCSATFDWMICGKGFPSGRPPKTAPLIQAHNSTSRLPN